MILHPVASKKITLNYIVKNYAIGSSLNKYNFAFERVAPLKDSKSN